MKLPEKRTKNKRVEQILRLVIQYSDVSEKATKAKSLSERRRHEACLKAVEEAIHLWAEGELE